MPDAYIVVGLGYGDEGKGTVVDYLTRQYKAHTVIRFNGGAQAAHNVITPDGKHHTFAQFGSGTLAGARTHLSQYMLVNPFDMPLEARHLQQLGVLDPLKTISISPEALITTPLHIAANQIKEEMRTGKHGTCGKGIGETQEIANLFGEDAIRMKDLRMVGIVEAKLKRLSDHYATTLLDSFAKEHGPPAKIAKAYQAFSKQILVREDDWMRHAQGTIIFEGAQGILLDQDVGFHPHTTWSRTTSRNARKLLGPNVEPTVIGVTRPYTTRHGAGPIAGGYPAASELEPHNGNDGFQGQFFHAPWDALALDYAAKCDQIDAVAVTCLDQLERDWSSIWSYEYEGDMPDLSPYFWADGKRIFQIVPADSRAHIEAVTTRLKECKAIINVHKDVSSDYVIDAMGEVLHAPVTIQSFGPTYKDKKERVLAWTETS